MMKTLAHILTILAIGTSFQLYGQRHRTDKKYIFKDTIHGVVQSIFIDYNSSSKYFNSISDFTLKDYEKDSYKTSTDYFRANKLTLNKARPVIPWTKWVKLLQYKDRFYVYHPCDFMYHFQQSINDTTFIDWVAEGPVANKIIKQKKIDSKTYEFKLTGMYSKERNIMIHVIDPKKGIAIFEENSSYYLMIAAEKIKSVPIIVNYCPIQKQMEFHGDNKIDLKTLLTTKSRF